MNEKISRFKMRATAVAVASCLSMVPWLAEAAGLGRITVLSNLGQTLRAEVDVGANREELSGMTVRLAPADSFRQAGIDYASVLRDLRFTLDKRPNGNPVIVVSSSKAINEPFLDFLVELNWPTGRLVREYTFLLDPPEVAAKSADKGISVTEAKPVAAVPGGTEAEPVISAAPKETPVRSQSISSARPKAVESEEKVAEPRTTRLVKPGDTLRKIAVENQYEGVSLEQMLVGLFRANSSAFMGGNINRMRSGVILNVPDRDAVAAVPEGEAKKIYRAQAADWNAYRQKLAAAAVQGPAREEAVGQSAGGKITAKVEEKAAPAEAPKDQVKVSRTEAAGAGKAAEENLIAKDKSLKEAQDRLASLEKNVADLQKLVDMKNQSLAELQKQAAAKKADEQKVSVAPAMPVKPAEPQPVAEAPKPAEAAKPAEPPKPAEAPLVAEAPKPAEAPKVEAAKPADLPPPAEGPKPIAPPKKPAAPPPPPPEPEFLDELMDNPLALAGAGGIVALLAGYYVVRRRRQASGLTTMGPLSTDDGANSVFRATGGQSVDTGNTTPQTMDFSQTGPGTIDTDEVDPVAEADVYMAYGRDAQAEEILLEALQKDPQRTAIHVKLLEIYAARKSAKQFETLASELYAQTGGHGPDWEKAATLGAGLDPNNPLFAAGRAAAEKTEPAFDPEATLIIPPREAPSALPAAAAGEAVDTALPAIEEPIAPAPVEMAPTEPVALEPLSVTQPDVVPELGNLDFDLGTPTEPASEEAAASLEELAPVPEAIPETTVLDFDLGLSAPAAAPAETPAPAVEEAAPLEMHALDFDLGVPESAPVVDEPSPVVEEPVTPEPADPLDFDLDIPLPAGEAREPAPVAEAAPEPEAQPEETVSAENPLDFDLDIGLPEPVETIDMVEVVEPEAVPLATPEEVEAAASDFDFDLDLPAAAPEPEAVPAVRSGAEEALASFMAGSLGGQAAESEAELAVDEMLDFDIGLPAEETPAASMSEAVAETPPAEEQLADVGALEFDIDLGDPDMLGTPASTAGFDLSAINLDLGAEGVAEEMDVATAERPAAAAKPAADLAMSRDAHWEEVNTKLDLAKAYEEMGDFEGARELLQEVMGEGPADLSAEAKDILTRLKA